MSKAVQAEARLRELLLAGSLPASACGRALLDLLEPLLAGGILIWERSGAGRRLAVTDSSVLARFVESKYPSSQSGSGRARVEALGRFRDTKALPNDAAEIVVARAFRPGALTRDGVSFGADRLTAEHGVFAFRLDAGAKYALEGTCGLVENPALFEEFERLGEPVAMAILARGRASDRLVNWLAAQEGTGARLVHFPDYDPVGLSEFLRMESRLGERVQLHLPPDLRERFRRFSNPALLAPLRSSEMLGRLRRCARPEVAQVVAAIDEFGAGLEQESLLLKLP